MIDLLKNAVALMFGKSAGTAWIAIGFAGVIGYAGFLYLSNEALKQEIEKLDLVIEDRNKAIISMQENIRHLAGEIDRITKDYQSAIQRRTEAEESFLKLQKEHAKQVEVFEKERGRFTRLFERKAQLITNRANEATKERGNEITNLTSN